ncbi:DnaJ (Hsp40), sub C, member 17 [Mortierella polycephala]|uniref:DnaJ (Hsp40), sub C, member 17 n=1 Tax=Mortierella polycephala TaxID=41804 RepID=A0A9P6PRI8_9FUNG|nr:DnaJ (Hsp40), sub C, member 17 [Mortierella polycephala]
MAEAQLDWYAVLGVERTATTKEITKAYRLKALKVHPDKNPDPNAAKIFHELSQAYDLLLDPAARAAFDNLLNVKVQAKERTDKYDTVRKKMKEDLENRENAFKRQQQDEKAAALRMQYEMERLKQENSKKRAEREAELLRQADQLAEAAATARQAARDEEASSLDTTLKVKWKKKKHAFESGSLKDIFTSYGIVDSCLSKNQGSALVSFKTIKEAYTAMKAHEKEDKGLEAFTITWAGGVEPIAVASLRAKDSSASSASSTPPNRTPITKPPANLSSAFNVSSSTAFTPAFSVPAFGDARSGFGGFPLEIPNFAPPPVFDAAAPIIDDYEAATLTRMKSRDNERKRLAEEMLKRDQEEEERQKVQTDMMDKKQKV